MKKTVLSLFLLFVWNAFAQADVPKYISFQGELTDSQGTRITTSKSVTFKLHSAASGGAILWSEVQTLTPANGIVSAAIGSATAGGVSLAFDTGYWLGVTVSPDAEMSPRIRLTTSPYAFIAKYLDTGAAAYGALSVAETVTANKFVGNGAALTGVTASSSAPDTDWNMTGGTSGDLYRLSGNVGIGTSGPTDSLHVVGPMRVMQTAEAGTFVINTSGKVGIGTASPAELLHVKGPSHNRLRADGGAGSSVGMNMVEGANSSFVQVENGNRMAFYSGDQSNPDVVITYGGNMGIGTGASGTPADSLHVAGRIMLDTNATAAAADGAIRWSGSDFEGRKAGAWASLTGVGAGGDITGVTAGAGLSGGGATGAVTVSVDPSYAHTWTGKQTFSAAAAFSDSVVVADTVLVANKQTGNVGVGTASPSGSLHVSGPNTLWTNPHIQIDQTSSGSSKIMQSSSGLLFRNFNPTGTNVAFDFRDPTTDLSALAILANKNVGIGSTAPGAKLDVVGSVLVTDSMVVGDTRLVVLKSGNVGIGTGNPSSALHISAASGQTPLNIGAPSNIILNMAPGSGQPVTLNNNASGPVTFSVNNAEKVRVDAAGNVGIGTTAPGSRLDVSGGAHVSDSFAVGGAAGDSLVVLRSGNVGIGTSVPSQLLHVSGSSDPTVLVGNSGSSVQSKLWSGTGGGVVGTGSNHPFEITTNNGVKMRINTNGNVGVGTTSPSDSLHVAGTARISDSITIGDTVFVVNSKSGKVGIGTASPAATLDVAGAAAFRGGAYTGANGSNNDISIPNASYVRLTGPAAAFTITGIAGGQDGRVLILHNATTSNMTITNNDVLSTAANQILTMTGAAVSTTGEGTVTLVYSATDSRWLVTSLQQ